MTSNQELPFRDRTLSSTVSYEHDALRRRVARKVDGTYTHRWLYSDRLNPVAEVDADGNTVSTFVYGTGINVPDYMERDQTTYYFVRDHLGSVRFVVNSATGTVAQELRYDAFGNVTRDTSPGFQPFGYAGGLYDHQTGLVRLGRGTTTPASAELRRRLVSGPLSPLPPAVVIPRFEMSSGFRNR